MAELATANSEEASSGTIQGHEASGGAFAGLGQLWKIADDHR